MRAHGHRETVSHELRLAIILTAERPARMMEKDGLRNIRSHIQGRKVIGHD